MPLAVIKVTSGGLAVSQAPAGYGLPCVLSNNGFGVAITTVTSGGLPIADATTGGGIFAGMLLSNATFLVGSATSSAIGNLSVVGGSGTYVFSLTDTASNKVKVAGTNGVNLQVGTTVATLGSFSITVTTTGGTPNFTQSFLITVLPVAPSNSGGANLPTITGTPVYGNTLTASPGTWVGNPVPTYAYQWKRAGVAIPGATATTYLLGLSDLGLAITVTVTATNVGGSASATSAATATVAGIAPVNSVAPVIAGSAVDGHVLTLTSVGTWSGTPAPTYTYQWKRGATNVGTGATTYTIATIDVGANMTCVVTATNPGNSVNATSNTLGPVTAGGNYLIDDTNDYLTDNSGNRLISAVGTPDSAAYTNFIARATTLDGIHRPYYKALLDGLTTDGLFNSDGTSNFFDVLYIFATQDPTNALLNLVSSSFTATNVGSLSFVADRGVTGLGNGASRVDTNFPPLTAPTPKYTQNSAHLSMWNLTNAGTPLQDMSGGTVTTFYSKYTSDGNMYGRINDNPATGGFAVTDPRGHLFANRSSSTARQLYQNASTTLNGGIVATYASNNAQQPSAANIFTAVGTSQLAMSSAGASLNATQVTNFYNRLRTYMTSVGVP